MNNGTNEMAKIGDIWVVTIPVLSYEENGEIDIKIQKRPCLILDDGRGLIVEEDQRNLHVLKLTTQNDPYKRKLIKNWKEIGLVKKSYVRIELPIKIEKEQLNYKVAELPAEQLIDMYSEVYNLINIDALQKIIEKNKESMANV